MRAGIARVDLLHLLKSRALKTGDFTLKSGRKSNYLIDCKDVVLSPVGHRLVGEVMFRGVNDLYDREVPTPAVAGVELGGCPLASAVAYYSHNEPYPVHAIYVRKEQKDHGSKSLLEGTKFLQQGAEVIILEDVTTTGGSALAAAVQLWKYGFDVLGVYCLVDRQEGASEMLADNKLKLWSVFTKEDFGV